MPSCSATDTTIDEIAPSPFIMAAMAVSPAGQDCPKERYCDEAEHGRPACPPGRCRYGGKEHDKIPCPDHDRPFGLAASTGGSSRAAKAKGRTARAKGRTAERRPKKTAGRRKTASRSAPKRKPARKPKARKKTRR